MNEERKIFLGGSAHWKFGVSAHGAATVAQTNTPWLLCALVAHLACADCAQCNVARATKEGVPR